MKTKIFTSVIAVSLLLAGCNKDEDILIDDPGQQQPDPDIEQELQYSVVAYLPGPGQYINEVVSGFSDITTEAEAISQAQKRLKDGLYVSLGGWGGYIVVKFNKPIQNTGDFDFSITSNSFDSSNEPGIVWVMQDANKNGEADDEWFELKGSHFGEEGYERNYWVKYSRPSEADSPTPWEDSNGEKGEVMWMGSYHNQPFYYPNWVREDSYILYGSRLPSRAYQDPVTGIWTNSPFEWGYADNMGSDFLKEGYKNLFKISNAVTAENQPADLKSIDFIKVQTAVNGNSGWLGENSTEICGFSLEN